MANFNVTYTPGFQHREWIDNVDRVQASGDNGLNKRFNDLIAEFGSVADAVTQINAALNTLAQGPGSRRVSLTLTPNLVAIGSPGWAHTEGRAERQPAQSANDTIGAHGMQSVDLPAGAKIQTWRATGRNTGTGKLRITLRRLGLTADPAQADQIALASLSADTSDSQTGANAQFATVDTDNFKYYIVADLDTSKAADIVQITAFQIVYTIG